MSDPTTHPVKYKLTGAVKGKTAVYFGFPFRDGVCVLSGEAHDNCGKALSSYHAAYPEDIADKMNADAEVATVVPIIDKTAEVIAVPKRSYRPSYNKHKSR